MSPVTRAHAEVGQPAHLDSYERPCGESDASLCLSLAFGLVAAAFGSRRYYAANGVVRWSPGPGWMLLAAIAKRLPAEKPIRTGWDGPEVPEPPEPEPASTKRPDGMTTSGWDDPHGTERP